MTLNAIETLTERANLYISLDKNESTRTEIKNLLDKKEWALLDSRVGSHMTFGTAGLRAEMGGGFNRMNCLTVIQASQGLCAYMTTKSLNSIVIGHDHRYNSETFAKLAAATFLSKGFKVYFYKDVVFTPLVPFAVKELKAGAGIMMFV